MFTTIDYSLSNQKNYESIFKGVYYNKVKNMKKHFKINATTLKFIALGLMLVDHLWASVIPGNQWMTFVGRLAFPIFAFQIVEGYHHTSSVKNYKKRLLIFALLSEIPYDLFKNSTMFYPFDQNVMFTLLIGLFMIDGLNKQKDQSIKAYAKSGVIIFIAYFIATAFFVDYGGHGILMILVFYLFKDHKLLQLAGLFLINVVLFEGFYIPIEFMNHTFEFQTQGFALLALPFIWLYDGQKHHASVFVKQFAYWFYPAHMLILYLIPKVVGV